MAMFEGKEFAVVNDEMPSYQWNEEQFYKDWESEITASADHWRAREIEIAKESVIKNFYNTYSDLFQMIDDEEDIDDAAKSNIRKKLNRAMLNVLEYGHRRSMDIVKSLRDRKMSHAEAGADMFNAIIDNLILDVQNADKVLHDELKQHT